MNTEEYVPIAIPIMIPKVNPLILEPPNTNMIVITMKVMKEVIIVLPKVLLIEALITSDLPDSDIYPRIHEYGQR